MGYNFVYRSFGIVILIFVEIHVRGKFLLSLCAGVGLSFSFVEETNVRGSSVIWSYIVYQSYGSLILILCRETCTEKTLPPLYLFIYSHSRKKNCRCDVNDLIFFFFWLITLLVAWFLAFVGKRVRSKHFPSSLCIFPLREEKLSVQVKWFDLILCTAFLVAWSISFLKKHAPAKSFSPLLCFFHLCPKKNCGIRQSATKGSLLTLSLCLFMHLCLDFISISFYVSLYLSSSRPVCLSVRASVSLDVSLLLRRSDCFRLSAFVCLSPYVCMYVCAYVCRYVCLYVCKYVCIYILCLFASLSHLLLFTLTH